MISTIICVYPEFSFASTTQFFKLVKYGNLNFLHQSNAKLRLLPKGIDEERES